MMIMLWGGGEVPSKSLLFSGLKRVPGTGVAVLEGVGVVVLQGVGVVVLEGVVV